MKRVLIVALAFLAGCSSPDHVELDSHWRPLTRLQSNPATPPGVYQTLEPFLLTHDLSEWLSMDTTQQDGLLKHEQLHAIRQQATGVAYWAARYVVDMPFRWQEERLGWALQIHYVLDHGGQVDVEYLAGFLSGPVYSAFDGKPMISVDEAREWLARVMSGAE